jgi:hypothetical protein
MSSTAERFGDQFGAERMWGLKELPFPDAVGVFPLAPGWYGLLGVVLVVVLFGCWRWRIRWRANAYRRDALAEVRGDPRQLPFVLRKAALHGFPRDEVASLRGADWIGWLNETGGETLFEARDAALLDVLAYAPETAVGIDDSQRLAGAAETWLRCHVCV